MIAHATSSASRFGLHVVHPKQPCAALQRSDVRADRAEDAIRRQRTPRDLADEPLARHADEHRIAQRRRDARSSASTPTNASPRLANPMPGIDDDGARGDARRERAVDARRAARRTTSPTGSSPVRRVRERRHGRQRRHASASGQPRRRSRRTRAPSRASSRKADTSFTIDAPASSAACRDRGLDGVHRDRHARMVAPHAPRRPESRGEAPRRRRRTSRPAAASIHRRCR